MRTPQTLAAVSYAFLCLVLLGLAPCVLLQAQSIAPKEEKALDLAPQARLDPRAVNAFVAALVLEQSGDYYAAVANFKQALTYNPTSSEIRLSLAELYFSLRSPKEALNILAQVERRDGEFFRLQGACYQAIGEDQLARLSYRELLKWEPDNEAALTFLASSYRQANDTASTIWALEQLARLGSATASTYTELGRLYAATNQTAKAKEAFQTSIAHDAGISNLISFSFLAEAYAMRKQFDSAISTVDRALALDPDNFFLNNQMVSLLARSDSLPRALPYARKTAGLRPTDAALQRRLAMIYARVDSLDIADSIFSDIVKNGQETPTDHFFLGQIAVDRKQFKVAKSEFERLVAMEDSVGQNWQSLAFSEVQLGDTSEAIGTYRRAIERVPGDSSKLRLTFSLGAIQERSGQFDSAATTFRTLLQKWPGYAPALNYLGYMYADKGVNLGEAKSLIEQALKAEPQNPAFLDSYGWVYFRLNKYDQALEHLTKAASLTKDAVVFEHLGDTYKALGKLDQAREWWQKSLDLDPKNKAIKEKLAP